MSQILENPRGGCILSGISSTLAAIEGFCPVFHAGPGCTMQTSASTGAEVEIAGVQVPCSNMLEREVVFGGVRKLESTVQGAIEVMDAKAYVILTGCTAGVIGDDVNAVAESFRAKGQEVYAIDTPGFIGNTEMGYDIVWSNLIRQFIKPSSKEEKTVNLFGIIPGLDPFWRGNVEELSRILRELGLKVNNFFRDGQGIEEVRKSSGAALNIIVHPWLFKGPAEQYEEKFGVPYLRFPNLPIGDTDTTEFVRAVGEKLGLDQRVVEDVVEQEQKYLYSYLEHGIGVLGWKRLAVIGPSATAIGIARYMANDYSLLPRVVIITDPNIGKNTQDIIRSRLAELTYVQAPDIFFEPDQYEINEILKKYTDVTMTIGSANDREAASYQDTEFYELCYPVTSRFIFNQSIIGYKGSLTLIEDLFSNL